MLSCINKQVCGICFYNLIITLMHLQINFHNLQYLCVNVQHAINSIVLTADTITKDIIFTSYF